LGRGNLRRGTWRGGEIFVSWCCEWVSVKRYGHHLSIDVKIDTQGGLLFLYYETIKRELNIRLT
jgi:hypothetical protein